MRNLIDIIDTDNEINILQKNIVFKPSNVHRCHYVIINQKFTGIVVNFDFYSRNKEYKNEINNKIKEIQLKQIKR